jgi:hypothetical protein
MPLTVPTHPAAVLPLKLWRHRWFDGVALAVGSAAPDLAYPLDGSGLPVWPLSHQWRGLVLWCLPVTLLVVRLIRRAAPVLARHLPPLGPLALRDYGSLGGRPHARPITWCSALLAAASHLLLDRFEAVSPIAEHTMHVLGAAGLLAILLAIGRPRLLRLWHGEPPPVRARPVPFWTVAAGVTAPSVAVTPFLPAAALLHTTAVRLLCAVAAGLLFASLTAAAVDSQGKLQRNFTRLSGSRSPPGRSRRSWPGRWR